MTYAFFNPNNGIYIIYDTASGAVIRTCELEAYICDALYPCGEDTVHLPVKCPSDIRYELARFASTEVSAAYENIKKYYSEGLIYGNSEKIALRLSGDHSADRSLLPLILSETGLTEREIDLIN